MISKIPQSALQSAADPTVSAWVDACAGAGKTKILIDRILNLLLAGFAPEKILCLTFTKAAAVEMVERLNARLKSWATLSEETLIHDLLDLLGKTPTPQDCRLARHLFTRVLDAAGGMKIQTIHAFCQNILRRFPLEASVPPHFQIIEDTTAEELLTRAQNLVLAASDQTDVEQALTFLSAYMDHSRFRDLLQELHNHRSRLRYILQQQGDSLETALRSTLGIDSSCSLLDLKAPQQLIQEFCAQDPSPYLVDTLGELTHKEDKEIIETWLSYPEKRFDLFANYQSIFLTDKGEIRKKQPDQHEAERLYRLQQTLNALEAGQKTFALLILGREIFNQYQNLKETQTLLDYDDLILKTNQLLERPGISPWVLYKLDGGIDHILIDEAQDTSPQQWNIVRHLTAEFFSNDKPYRTIFAVGDPQQSIYSFQEADPREFMRYREYFAIETTRIEQTYRYLEQNQSYRSTSAIIDIVNQTCATLTLGVPFKKHRVLRDDQPGLVEMWPLIPQNPLDRNQELWPLPLAQQLQQTPQQHLANFIVKQIQSWLGSPVLLPSTGRPTQPGDILILVRRRTSFVDTLIRILKQNGIAVAGTDRLILNNHLAIMDLLALGQFLLLPEDDLNLASLLKSPLIGFNEADLFSLAYGRKGSLWSELKFRHSEHSIFKIAHTWLITLINQTDTHSPYELYSSILASGGKERLIARSGQEVEEIIEEFLSQILVYEKNHSSSLQGFITFLQNSDAEIKRDSIQSGRNEIKIMTVHGAKGLESPIVILPDTTDPVTTKVDPFLWQYNEHGLKDLLVLRPSQEKDCLPTKTLKQAQKQRDLEEHYRLLYVALTRAKDRLYIGGWERKKMAPEDCWYTTINHALKTQGISFTTSLGEGWRHQPIPDKKLAILEANRLQETPSLPLWAKTSVPQKTFKLSQPIESKTDLADRGIILHRLFEVLPTIKDKEKTAHRLLKTYGLEDSQIKEYTSKVLAILDNPQFAALFGSHSQAEVTISGDNLPHDIRIDRLVVQNHEVLIVDYKTSDNPPVNPSAIPSAYRDQLALYVQAVSLIYPQHKIRAFLLWTAIPHLMEIDI